MNGRKGSGNKKETSPKWADGLQWKQYAREGRLGPRVPFAPELCRQKLAEELGMNGSHLSRIMRGQTMPTVATLKRIAEAFRTSLDRVERFLNESARAHN